MHVRQNLPWKRAGQRQFKEGFDWGLSNPILPSSISMMFGAGPGSCCSSRRSDSHLALRGGFQWRGVFTSCRAGGEHGLRPRSPRSATHWLCDLEQVTEPLPTCVFICRVETVITTSWGGGAGHRHHRAFGLALHIVKLSTAASSLVMSTPPVSVLRRL